MQPFHCGLCSLQLLPPCTLREVSGCGVTQAQVQLLLLPSCLPFDESLAPWELPCPHL